MTKKIKLKISSRLLKKRSRKNGFQRRSCRFCGNAEQESLLDYKNAGFLKHFLTERGKILPSRISGVCALHQRALSSEIKKARIMALLSFVAG